MARLVLSLDGQVLAEYNMTKERYTVGRLPDNDVRVDNPAVSGHHSLVINILNDSFLEDLSSTNGTYVNGKLVKKHALQHGDVITVGHHQLRFVDENIEQASADEFEKTMIIRPGSQAGAPSMRSVQEAVARAGAAPMDTMANPDGQFERTMPHPGADAVAADARFEGTMPHPGAATAGQLARSMPPAPPPPQAAEHSYPPYQPPASAPAQQAAVAQAAAPAPMPAPGKMALPKAKIQVLSGAFAGKELALTKALTTLGRPGLQVAAITRRAEGYFIVHVDGGPDGRYPKVNGEPIGPQARRLHNNDVVELAGVKMGFFDV